ncbi:alpha/beta hydrolase [Streptomyces sp. NPDC005828]|uniref:alpha/beta fold hydrolase n=1 Tax=Streptomyces sp. NPDC005828 TaxID=3157071 RepID=UPI00340A6F2D
MTVSDSGPWVDNDAETTESSLLPLDDGDIHVCQDGPRDAPALLLLHGSASSTRSWDPMVPTFTATMLATRSYLEQRALPDRLTALGGPLLVLFGEDDRRWRSSSAADYRAVPGAEAELLPGLGHSPLFEDPQRTATPLPAFTALHAVRVD